MGLKICPLLAMTTNMDTATGRACCVGKECAWWCEDLGKCVLHNLRLIAHEIEVKQ